MEEKMKKLLSVGFAWALAALFIMPASTQAAIGDVWCIGGATNGWCFNAAGNIVPFTAAAQDIGSSG